jgi:hypothetical protein
MAIFEAAEGEILRSLQNERNRLEDAAANIAYYYGDFGRYQTLTRSSMLMQLIINKLTSNLYKASPARTIPGHPEATAFLNNVYKSNAAFALWQSADRLSACAEVAAFQVAGTTDPSNPVKVWLWSSDQFAVYLDPDDPTRPIAVVTIDAYDASRRYTLWTAGQRAVYITDKANPWLLGGNAPRRILVEDNPYGVLPFSFVHFDFPTTDFWSGSPGTQLRQVNEYINHRLTESADNIRYLGRPLGVAEGVSPQWEPPKNPKPGDFITLSSSQVDAGGDVVKPSLKYLEADLGFVDAEWADMNNYLNLTLETHGIPEAAIRMVQSAGRSGVSIQSEQIPILSWVQGRKLPYSHYEEDLARLVLQVANAHLGNNGIDNAYLRDALDGFSLSLRWPDLWTELPGEERDRSDEWMLRNGLASKIGLVQKRLGMTRDEAIQELERLALDTAEEQRIFGAPAPIVQTTQISGEQGARVSQEAV